MEKLEYTDEETFITEEVEFEETHVELVNEIKDFFVSELIHNQIMVGKDKKSLIFGVDLSNRVGHSDEDDTKFRISIVVEKIKNDE